MREIPLLLYVVERVYVMLRPDNTWQGTRMGHFSFDG